jgi:CheY-like chemotaxis protein
MMGGKLSLHSEVGVGSCFSFTLPLVEVSLKTQPIETEEKYTHTAKIHFQPAMLLLVDDAESNRKLIKSYLTNHHELQIVEAINGTQALAAINDYQFDLIFMDKHLPDIDGNIVCEKIKSQPHYQSVPIIMITASSISKFEAQQQKFYDLLLSKPISKADLLVGMQSFLNYEKNQEIKLSALPKKAEITPQSTLMAENLSSLIELLESNYQKHIEKLNKSGAFEIDVFIEIGEELLQIAEQHHCNLLKNWANALKNQAQLFDIENLSRTLKGFEGIVEQLRHSLSTQ